MHVYVLSNNSCVSCFVHKLHTFFRIIYQLQVVEKSQGLQGAVVQLTPGGIPAFGGVGGGSTEFRIGILLETALQRAPILMMKSGQIREAVEQYRGVLRAQETTSTQSLRMTLARQVKFL